MSQPTLFAELLPEEELQRIINIGFAALIIAYGKPIYISRGMVEKLPERFEIRIEEFEGGKRFTVQTIEEQTEVCQTGTEAGSGP